MSFRSRNELEKKTTRDGVVFLRDLGAEQNSAYHRAKIKALVRFTIAIIIEALNQKGSPIIFEVHEYFS